MKVKYDNHPNEWIDIINNSDKLLSSLNWLNKNTVDYWRHTRIRETILPLIKGSTGKKWLTIGDGRFGTDANYLIHNGISDVTATDISDELLKIGNERGFIKKYSAQNAEKLTFSNDEFDYTYCKEAYHHFPRPYLAVYEMLRVSKYAIALSEPTNQKNSLPIRILKKLVGKKNNVHSFESIGNYVYCISISEIEKLMLGLGLRHYAYIGINDHYIPGIENIPMIGGNLNEVIIQFRLRFLIFIKNLTVRFGFLNSNLLTIIIFKIQPTNSQIKDMKSAGFHFITLPKNPFAN